MDHNHHDCILVAVLSHGEMGIIYAKDTAYKPDLFWSSFTADKCPTLAGIPLFDMFSCFLSKVYYKTKHWQLYLLYFIMLHKI